MIAADVGCDSDAAFSRAFNREFGAAPATWRRTRLASHSGDAEVAIGVPWPERFFAEVGNNFDEAGPVAVQRGGELGLCGASHASAMVYFPAERRVRPVRDLM